MNPLQCTAHKAKATTSKDLIMSNEKIGQLNVILLYRTILSMIKKVIRSEGVR